MLLFCPSCSNALTITALPQNQSTPSSAPEIGHYRFECRTCPYQMPLEEKRRYFERKTFSRKTVEDVLGGKESWGNVDKTEVQCPREDCDSTQAFFKQAQLRSADEPMTLFYKCVKCGCDWREG